MKEKINKWGEPLVPCRYCGTDTAMTGTRMCDRCWELDRHVRGNPKVAAKILKEIQK